APSGCSAPRASSSGRRSAHSARRTLRSAARTGARSTSPRAPVCTPCAPACRARPCDRQREKEGRQMPENDTYDLLPLFRHLRVVDVADAMDGMGYFDIGLLAPEIRPLWLGMKFWGVAVTQRLVPSNRPMWKLDT